MSDDDAMRHGSHTPGAFLPSGGGDSSTDDEDADLAGIADPADALADEAEDARRAEEEAPPA